MASRRFLVKTAIFVFFTLLLVNVPYTIYLVRSVQLTQIYRVRKPILILPGMKSAAQIRLVQPAAGGTATALTTVYRRSTVRNLAGQEAAIGMIATGSRQAQPWSSQVASAGMIAAGNWNSTILVGQEAAIGMIATGSSQGASAGIIAAGNKVAQPSSCQEAQGSGIRAISSTDDMLVKAWASRVTTTETAMRSQTITNTDRESALNAMIKQKICEAVGRVCHSTISIERIDKLSTKLKQVVDDLNWI